MIRLVTGSLTRGEASLNLWRLRCALGSHDYSFQGVMFGNRLDRCLCCGKVRVAPTVSLASVDRLPTLWGR